MTASRERLRRRSSQRGLDAARRGRWEGRCGKKRLTVRPEKTGGLFTHEKESHRARYNKEKKRIIFSTPKVLAQEWERGKRGTTKGTANSTTIRY